MERLNPNNNPVGQRCLVCNEFDVLNNPKDLFEILILEWSKANRIKYSTSGNVFWKDKPPYLVEVLSGPVEIKPDDSTFHTHTYLPEPRYRHPYYHPMMPYPPVQYPDIELPKRSFYEVWC